MGKSVEMEVQAIIARQKAELVERGTIASYPTAGVMEEIFLLLAQRIDEKMNIR